jgi:hypothetical protein
MNHTTRTRHVSDRKGMAYSPNDDTGRTIATYPNAAYIKLTYGCNHREYPAQLSDTTGAEECKEGEDEDRIARS